MKTARPDTMDVGLLLRQFGGDTCLTQVSEFKLPISLAIIDAPTPSRARQVEGY